MTLTPAQIAVTAGLAGVAMAVAGVYLLAGTGWALIAAAVPAFALAGIILRGLNRAADPE